MKRLRLVPISLLVAALLAVGLMPTAAPGRIALAQSEGDSAEALLSEAAQNMLAYDTMKFDLVYEKGQHQALHRHQDDQGVRRDPATGQAARDGADEGRVRQSQRQGNRHR